MFYRTSISCGWDAQLLRFVFPSLLPSGFVHLSIVTMLIQAKSPDFITFFLFYQVIRLLKICQLLSRDRWKQSKTLTANSSYQQSFCDCSDYTTLSSIDSFCTVDCLIELRYFRDNSAGNHGFVDVHIEREAFIILLNFFVVLSVFAGRIFTGIRIDSFILNFHRFMLLTIK